MANISIKRGDTFSRACTYKRDGVPFDLTGAVIVAIIRDAAGGVVDSLDVPIPSQTGINVGGYFLRKNYTATAAWPVGAHRFNIRYTFPDGTRVTSETINLTVEKELNP